MALTSLERVRRKIGDKLVIRREVTEADGVSDHFKMASEPIAVTPVPQIWNNDNLQVEGTDYSIDYEQGVISFAAAPAANDKLVFQYYSVIWADEEIQDFLDQYGDNVNISAAHILLAWAADVAKIAQRETLSGGGGLGAVTRDTSVAARELRNTAAALLEYEQKYGVTGREVPADAITEIPWTEAAAEEIDYQRWLREEV